MLALGKQLNHLRRRRPGQFYTKPRLFSGGIDLHAGMMYACILDQHGEMRLHHHMPASPETLLKAVAPYREDMVATVECVFTWYWLANLAPTGALVSRPCPIRERHSWGQSQNDPIDAQNMAVLLPQAYACPAAKRTPGCTCHHRATVLAARAGTRASARRCSRSIKMVPSVCPVRKAQPSTPSS